MIGRRRRPAAGRVEIETLLAAQQRDAFRIEARARLGALQRARCRAAPAGAGAVAGGRRST